MRNLCAIILVCVMLGCGCTSSIEVQNRGIAMRASLGEVLLEESVPTKAVNNVNADPYTGTPSGSNPLDAALWFSYTPGLYSHNPQLPQYLPCATTVTYASAVATDIRCGNQVIQYPIATDINYNQVGDAVYCVGLYPDTGWGELTSVEVNSASHAINGSEDLMFADQMLGTYSNNFGVQTFNHLLTWVKINLSATSMTAGSVWGDVKTVKIISPNKNVKIAFYAPVQKTDPLLASKVTYDGGAEEFLLELPENKRLSITSRTYGQAFCAPPAVAALNSSGQYEYVSGGNPEGELGYIVRVETTKIPEKEIFVALKKEDNTTPIENAGYAVGKLFVLNLHFNDIAVVEGVCTLTQWDDQNSDIYLK